MCLVLEDAGKVCRFFVLYFSIVLWESGKYIVGNHQIMEFGGSHEWHLSKASIIAKA